MHVTMVGVEPPFTVENTIFDCGVMYIALFNGVTKAERMNAEIFDDEFLSYMENTYKEFEKDLKSYSNLTVVNGRINIGPGYKKTSRLLLNGLGIRYVWESILP